MGFNEKAYNSFSGTDIVASITIHESIPPIMIGELQTISYSIHREVAPVRTLGRINPVGFTGGQRTIAGSLIFTVFDRNFVYEILEVMKKHPDVVGTGLYGTYLMDEMPPFDVQIIMNNEYGQQAGLTIKGVVIVDEGQVMSIEDMITENTMSYMAESIEPLNELDAESLGSAPETNTKAGTKPGMPTNIRVDVQGKDITVTFKKDPNAEWTFLDLWCDQIPDYETKDEIFKFKVDQYDQEYNFMLMSQGYPGSDGRSETSGYSQVIKFRSGDLMPGPTGPRVTPEETTAHINFTKGASVASTEIQVVPFNTQTGIPNFSKSFENTDAIISDETTGTSFYITGLTKTTSYYFRMRSKDSGGSAGRWSTISWNFRTKPWI